MDRAIRQAIGNRVKQYREAVGLTQEALAERVGLSTNYISAIERGVSFPRIERLVAVINEVQASADQIFIDVIQNSSPLRESVLSDEIEKLPSREQQRIFAVVEAMILEANKS